MAKIPSRNITRDDTKKLKDLDRSLKRMVFGQNKAIEEIATSIRLSRAGLRSYCNDFKYGNCWISRHFNSIRFK